KGYDFLSQPRFAGRRRIPRRRSTVCATSSGEAHNLPPRDTDRFGRIAAEGEHGGHHGGREDRGSAFRPRPDLVAAARCTTGRSERALPGAWIYRQPPASGDSAEPG